MHDAANATLAALDRHVDAYGAVAVAVSGGIDSLTLATAAGRALGGRAQMFHAVSAAVPPEATRRVRERAAIEGWRLEVIDAREFERAEYVANPVNRCFFCKQSLYRAIAQSTRAQILSGTNADDLSEYRPGLDAARDAGVRHPFAELGIGKRGIRRLARRLDLGALAELPASPCLASRVETGIVITPSLLGWIHACENAVRRRAAAKSVRCRMRSGGVVVEIDAETLAALTEREKRRVVEAVAAIVPSQYATPAPALAPYRNGSAFLVGHG